MRLTGIDVAVASSRAVPDNCWGRKSLYFRTPASKTTLDSIGKGAERYKVRQSMDRVSYGIFPCEAE